MALTAFTPEWASWIRTNVERGCSKDELARILVDHGFDRRAVRDALDGGPCVEERPPGASAPSPTVVANLRRIDSPRIELYTAEHFLDERECSLIVELARGRLRESTITAADEPDRFFRRSSTCDLGLFDDPAVRGLERRMCTALGTSGAYAEPIQAQHYDPLGEFKPHTDYFEEHELHRFVTPTLGQRSWTFMVYLNQDMQGGETAFVNAGLIVKPRTGLAVIWNNLFPDGRPNLDSMHHGMPVRSGHKDIVTKWFRLPRRS
jgi:prolyl 4-hydroxylase